MGFQGWGLGVIKGSGIRVLLGLKARKVRLERPKKYINPPTRTLVLSPSTQIWKDSTPFSPSLGRVAWCVGRQETYGVEDCGVLGGVEVRAAGLKRLLEIRV